MRAPSPLIPLLLLTALARAEEVVVRVTDGAQPLQHVGVQPLDPEREVFFDRLNWAPARLTDKTGQAVVDVAQGGKVLVYSPGFALAVASSDRVPIDVTLEPERIFRGRVRDRTGKPVGGAQIVLRTLFRQPASFATTSDKQGNFFVYGLWFDDYELGCSAPGFRPLTRAAQRSGLELRLARSASLGGRVVGSDGHPLAGLTLRLGTQTTASTKDGSFAFADTDPGRHKLAIAPPYGLEPLAVVLGDGEQRTDLELVALLPAQLALRVVDEGGQPIRAIQASGDLLERPVHSDARGQMILRVPPARKGTILVKGKGLASAPVPIGPEQPGAVRSLGDLVLRAHRPVEVEVRRPDGKPATKGKVGPAAIRAGKAVVPKSGLYEVAVPGFAPVLIDTGESTHITLPVPRWLSGVVRLPDQTPAAGARLLAGPRFETRTDERGRFSVGPFAGDLPVMVMATLGARSSSMLSVQLGGGELELLLEDRQPKMVRGIVSRGEQPVPRFRIGSMRFVSEEGRFELVLDRTEKRWIELSVEDQSYTFEIPAQTDLWRIQLPDGSITLGFEGAPPPLALLATASGSVIRRGQPGRDGSLRFAGLDRGVYEAWADGFESARVKPGETLLLKRAATGHLIVRLPEGLEARDPVRQLLAPGLHHDVFTATGAYELVVSQVRIEANGELDLNLAQGLPLIVRGEAGAEVRVRGRTVDAVVAYQGPIGRDRTFRLPHLPPGRYEVRSGLYRQGLEMGGRDAVELQFAPGAMSFADRVLIGAGRPAQHARLELRRVGEPEVILKALTNLGGRFVLSHLPPGSFEVSAHQEGYADGTATLTVSETGVAAEGFPITLERSAGVRVRLVGLEGEAMPGLSLRVDGHRQWTDALGDLSLGRLPTWIDLDLEGYASIRNLRIESARTIRLQRGADLVVLSDPAQGPVEVRIGGEVWAGPLDRGLARSTPGRLVLEDLPAGPVEIAQIAPQTEPDGSEEPPRSRLEQVWLQPGAETRVDLRP